MTGGGEWVANRGKFRFEDLVVGAEFHHPYTVSAEVYQQFTALFGDVSPLHVDDVTARSCGFSERLVHGAVLNGFISNFIGMHFPGRRSLELEVAIEYCKPTYVGDKLLLRATVKERLEALAVATLKFTFSRGSDVVARGKVRVMICDIP